MLPPGQVFHELGLPSWGCITADLSCASAARTSYRSVSNLCKTMSLNLASPLRNSCTGLDMICDRAHIFGNQARSWSCYGVCLCVCARVCACECVCVHVYKQTGKHMCVIQAVDVYMYTSKNAHYAQVCTNKCIYVCMYVCVCVYVCMSFTCMPTLTYLHPYMHIYKDHVSCLNPQL